MIESAQTAVPNRATRRLRWLEENVLPGVFSIPERLLEAFLRAGWQIERAKTPSQSEAARPHVLLLTVERLSADQQSVVRSWVDRCSMPRALVVVLCRDEDPSFRVRLLDTLADLVVSPDIEPQVLEAQVRALVDRLDPGVIGEPIQSGRLQLDASIKRLVCQRDGQRLETRLTPTECRILEVMIARPYRAHARLELVHAVWGVEADIDVRTIDVHMRRLREGLSRIDCQTMLETVRGVGYRLVPD